MRLLRIACVLALGLVLVGVARGDGDPASDVLWSQNVYFPYPLPSASARAVLKRSVSAVYARNYRIKVAVIATASDLGSVPELFKKPDAYAKFLGTEVGLFYIGPLLVAMPTGFGVYDGGRPTTAEDAVLAKATAPGSNPDGLVRSTAAVLDKLNAAGALKSKDIKKPQAQAYDGTGNAGKRVSLRFYVYDDSGKAREQIVISTASGRKVATVRVPLGYVNPQKTESVRWTIPTKPPARRLRFCVVAIDAAGNRSPRSCAQLTVT
jgi:hypothetical protein